MILRRSIAGAALASLAHAAQPGAVSPVAAPMRDLTWGQLNFIHTTDTHGWLGGHLQEPQYSADWGDYISFTKHMRKQASDKGADLLVVDTGDRVEGNGLYDASSPKGLFQYDIYANADVDLITVGNHELYQIYSAEQEHNRTIPRYKDNYITSNLDYVDFQTGERSPMTQRYRKFTTKKQGIEIIAFGFIFDFTGNNNNTVVQPVAETVKEEWFQDAIRQKPDLFVVIGHVGLRMQEFETIFTAIRKQNWHIPIAFFGGHAHVRDTRKFDSKAFAMASGRYLETIGWMSIDNLKKKEEDKEEDKNELVAAASSPSFSRSYIDNNLFGLHYHTGLNDSTFPTDLGRSVSNMILRARKALHLDDHIGCAPKNYWMARAKYPSKDNVYTWITDEVFPDIVTREDRKDKPRLVITNTGGIRFDIFKGAFTRDTTFTVSPFVSSFRYIPDVPYKAASKVIDLLNSGGRIFAEAGVHDISHLSFPQELFPVSNSTIDELDEENTTEGDDSRLELRSDEPKLIAGYTTKDDVGTDGDDTVHEPVKFYQQPNAIQGAIAMPEDGEPETVDMVFIDFVQPWIIPALKFAGADYSNDDVQAYRNGTLTYLMAEWVREHWTGDC